MFNFLAFFEKLDFNFIPEIFLTAYETRFVVASNYRYRKMFILDVGSIFSSAYIERAWGLQML